MTKFVAISDTHCLLNRVTFPEGEVLLHAGDLTFKGSISEITYELEVLKQLKSRFKHIILVAGNHDWLFQDDPVLARQLCTERGLVYLEDELFTIPETGLTVYGSPHQPTFFNWAFNLDRGSKALKEKWDLIPKCDILLTHSPPYGYGDKLDKHGSIPGAHVGCEELLLAVERVRPQVHVFGHIHSGYSITKTENTTFINTAICNEQYKPVNPPVTFEI